MNKAELIEYIAGKTKLPKNDCQAVLETLVETIEKTLKRGGSIVLTGFGTFTVMKRQARTGVNPATGATMKIPAKTVPKFKPGKKFKDMVA